MNISLGGRVVIVDDKWEEARPLFAGLSARGISSVYFTGQEQCHPVEPLTGVRFLFLDVDLWNLGGNNDKSQDVAKAHLAYFRKLISVEENGPLIIIFWTTYKERVAEIVSTIKTETKCKFIHCCLDKDEYKDTKCPGEYDVDRLMSDIVKEAAKTPLYVPFVLWENAVHSAVTKVSSDFVKLTPDGKSWDQCISYLFRLLDGATVSASSSADKSSRFRQECSVFNQCFLHVLNLETKAIVVPDGYKFTGVCEGVDERMLCAKINTFLGYDLKGPYHDLCGTVCKLDETRYRYAILKEALFKDAFDHAPKEEEKDLLDEIQLCEAIITPQCDMAQGHRLKIGTECGNVELHQVVYGLNIPCDRLNGLVVKGSEGRMQLRPYAVDDRIWMMVFCFYTIDQEVVKPDSWKPFMCLKREVLNDLQAHAASQLNRIGNSLLKVKLA